MLKLPEAPAIALASPRIGVADYVYPFCFYLKGQKAELNARQQISTIRKEEWQVLQRNGARAVSSGLAPQQIAICSKPKTNEGAVGYRPSFIRQKVLVWFEREGGAERAWYPGEAGKCLSNE
jgi:hypothetical protein